MNNLSYPHQCAALIKQRTKDFTPRVAIVLGSGLGSLAQSVTEPVVINYKELPGFPQPDVKGHAGEMTLGYLSGTPVVCLQGRPHYYEGKSHEEFKTYARTLKLIGCNVFLATNAAGSLRQDVTPGNLVMITDHINFQGTNPLLGPNQEEFGPRFIPLDKTYDQELRQRFHQSAKNLNITLHEGVYISVLGPTYETTAEIKAFKMLGADVVGMSTIPEVLVAHHAGLKIAVISTITNMATGLTDVSHSHDEVVIEANKAAVKLTELIKLFLTDF